MSDRYIQALLALGKGKMSGVRSPRWARMLQALSPGGQRDFANDRRQGAVAIAGRGAGKSYAVLARYDSVADAHPNCSAIFVAMSAERARDILMPAVWKMNEKLGTKIALKVGDNSLVWPNGFRVLMRGCGDRLECEKRRGTPWVMSHHDECASIHPALLEYDINEVIAPRLVDFQGSWSASGTPGPVEAGYWHKLSSGALGFPVYQWDARQNPHINALPYWLGELQRMQGVPPRDKWPAHCKSLLDLINDPECWKLLPPAFVREYLGRWIQDLSAIIYRLKRSNNYREYLLEPDFWTIGLDLGSHNDAQPHLDHTALTVAASNTTDPHIYIPRSRKLSNIDVELLATEVRRELAEFPEAVVQLDNSSAGNLILRTFQRWEIPVVAADRGPKERRIQLVQTTIDNDHLLLKEGECTDLRVESQTLVWDLKKREHSKVCSDDAWDSALYAVTPHLATPDEREQPAKRPRRGSVEAQELEELEEYERALQDAAAQLGLEAA